MEISDALVCSVLRVPRSGKTQTPSSRKRARGAPSCVARDRDHAIRALMSRAPKNIVKHFLKKISIWSAITHSRGHVQRNRVPKGSRVQLATRTSIDARLLGAPLGDGSGRIRRILAARDRSRSSAAVVRTGTGVHARASRGARASARARPADTHAEALVVGALAPTRFCLAQPCPESATARGRVYSSRRGHRLTRAWSAHRRATAWGLEPGKRCSFPRSGRVGGSHDRSAQLAHAA
jgi:hypothetical protein